VSEFDGPRPLWGEATNHALRAFPITGRRMPELFIHSIVEIKRAAALTNAELGLLDADRANAVVAACDEVLAGKHSDQFPVDVYQTGSATSSNMNVNEVVASIATTASGTEVLPHEHVNRGQSSNDVVPSAMRIAFLRAQRSQLLPALRELSGSLMVKADEFWPVLKIARTHLQDATPMRLGQEFWGWAGQVDAAATRIERASEELCVMPLGGTAVGTGVGAAQGFASRTCEHLSDRLGLPLTETTNHFWAQSTLDSTMSAHAAVRTAALSLNKVACDIRLLATGPRAGLGELRVPDVRVSSSIMPGKVPPSVIEAVTMATARVVGNDAVITFAQSGSILQLNVMMPAAVEAFLESVDLLSSVTGNFTQQCVRGIAATEVGPENVRSSVMLTTALTPHIGHHAAAEITQEALATGEPVDVVAARHGIPSGQFWEWCDPGAMTGAGDERPWPTGF
jgi:fumarate hydratase class II